MTSRVFGRFWNRALPLLLVTLGGASSASLAAPPTPPDGSAVLRIHGSNTVGAKLAPMLVAGLFEAKGLQSVRIAPAGKENEQRITEIGRASCRGRGCQCV